MNTQNAEKITEEDLIQRYWAIPKNVEQYRKSESEIRERIDAQLSRGNVHFRGRCGETEQDSDPLSDRVGWSVCGLR